MKWDGDGLGDGRHPDDNLVVMAVRDCYRAITLIFYVIFLCGHV